MYQHKVHYYETDKMGITHHANYVRWMEEARIYFLEKLGFPYDKLEEIGIISPVLEVNCQYKQSSTFSDVLNIQVQVIAVKGAKLTLSYQMTSQAGQEVCLAQSLHGFVNQAGQPVLLKKALPDFYQLLVSLVGEEDA